MMPVLREKRNGPECRLFAGGDVRSGPFSAQSADKVLWGHPYRRRSSFLVSSTGEELGMSPRGHRRHA
jgi:hypothetical protein